MKKVDKLLVEAIVKYNLLTQKEIDAHQKIAAQENKPFKKYLIENKYLTDKQISIALSQTLSLDVADISSVKIEESVIEKVPTKFAWYYKILPTKFENNILTVASANPIDVQLHDEIRNILGCEIEIVISTDHDLEEALRKYYGFASDTIDQILTKEPPKKHVSSSDSGQWVEDLETQTDDPTVSSLVNQIILEAYKKRATDIHIEPYRNKVRFRYRIDGALVDANLPQNVKHFLPSILSRIKILANLSITEKRLPQDGSAVVKTNDQNLDLRISTMPTPRGESMVIRILPTKVMHFTLEKLGFDKMSVEKYRYLLNKPHGIIFMTGPTGSGKTTSLYACLNEINSSKRKIITIEDPIEYEMEGISQVQVNPKVDFTFSTGLRSILRHDPDIIMVGEVRDLETAEISIRTALTGHLVFSSLHTNDACSGVTRLIDMGVEPYLVASSVEAFVAQRLIRVICPECKEEDLNPMPGIKQEIIRGLKMKNHDEIKIYKGKGCDHCNQTGYYGRIAISEILMLNDTIRAAILEKPRSDYIKQIAMKEGLTTLRQNGWRAVLSGVTTPDEVVNITVKDEYQNVDETSQILKDESVSSESDKPSKPFKFMKTKHREGWDTKDDYESRIYPRTFEPVEIRYRLAKQSDDDPNVSFVDEIEYTAVSEDISAGGLRFISKEIISIDSILDMYIVLGKGEQPINCLAKVCRVEEDSLESVYTITAYYLDISSADRVAINKFVELKKGVQSSQKEKLIQ